MRQVLRPGLCLCLLLIIRQTAISAQSVPKPTTTDSTPVATFTPRTTSPVTKTIELEWEPVASADSYEVKLTAKDHQPPFMFSTTENRLVQTVPVGEYLLQVRAHSKESGAFSPWSAGNLIEVAIKEIVPLYPQDKTVISAQGKDKQTIEFQWSPVKGVKIYTLKVWNEARRETPWLFTGKVLNKKLEVPPGDVYYWQVTFETADDVSYQQEPKIFSFTLQGKRLLRPEINAIPPGRNPKKLTWKATTEAQGYRVKLYFRHLDESEWALVREASVTKSDLLLDKPTLKPGAYKIEVFATATHRQNSETANREFVIKPTELELLQSLAKVGF